MAASGRGSGLYLRVGLLILAGIALAVGFVMFFTAGRLNRHSEIFETYFRESVQGLDVGAPVRYRGVQLGRVTEITLVNSVYRNPEGRPFQAAFQLVVVRFAIEQNRLGPEGTGPERAVGFGLRTRLSSAGLTGGSYIEMDFENPERFPVEKLPWAPAHPVIPSIPSTVAQVQDAAQNLLSRLQGLPLEDIMNNLDGVLADVHRQTSSGDLAKTLADVSAMAGTLRQTLDSTDIQGMVKDIRGAVADLRRTVAGPEMQATLRSTRDAAAQLNASMQRLPAVIGALERTARTAGHTTSDVNADLQPILRDLGAVAANLRDTTETLRRAPSQAILGAPPPPPAWATERNR